MRFVIQQTHECLPTHWTILWIHGSHTATSHVVNALTPACRARLMLRPLTFHRISVADYNQMCLSIDFWESLQPHENILIFQRDGCCLHMSPLQVDDFLAFDYVGAPWTDGQDGDPLFHRVGNGGFSLRKRRAMIRALTLRPHPEGPEDVFFGVTCADVIHVAPYEVAKYFSVEQETGVLIPFGFHKYRYPQRSRGTPEATYLYHTY